MDLGYNPGMPSPVLVQNIFTRVAPRYDLMNRLMTGGQDAAWRREVIRRARLAPGDHLLDLGSGTGDLAREARAQQPGCRVTAADFTLAMMLVGQQRPGPALTFSAADALNLPFPARSFDALTSGFLLRNVADLDRALREQLRVLKPGGRWVALDTTRPETHPAQPLHLFAYARRHPPAGHAADRPARCLYLLARFERGFLARRGTGRAHGGGRVQESGLPALEFRHDRDPLG